MLTLTFTLAFDASTSSPADNPPRAMRRCFIMLKGIVDVFERSGQMLMMDSTFKTNCFGLHLLIGSIITGSRVSCSSRTS
jgi:hypothetical protein